MSANNRQVGGVHYEAEYQHWDFVMDQRLGYFEGNITKYLSRADKKNGLQDLQKAVHYAEKMLEVQPYFWHWPSFTETHYIRFCKASRIDGELALLIERISTWRSRAELAAFLDDLTQYVRSQASAEPAGQGYVNQDRSSPP